MTAERVIWHVWDAAAHWVLRRLLDEGALPAIGAVARDGVLAAARPPQPNAQTPPGLATLFTGASPAEHGITGFSIPDPARGIAARRPAFERGALSVRPVWEEVGERGCDTVLVHVPWSVGPGGSVPRGCAFAVDGYSRRHARGGVVELSGGQTPVELAGAPARARRTPAGVCVTAGRDATVLPVDARGWTPWRRDGGPATLLRAVRRPSDGTILLLHLGAWSVTAGPGAPARRAAAEAGPFVGEGLGRWYRDGALGPTLHDGGDGWAERLLVETIAAAARCFARASRAALGAVPRAALTIAYQPCIDDAEHEVIGLCDPASPAYRPDLAERAFAVLRAVYGLADRHLAELLGAADEGTLVVVSSDHGMAGVSHAVHVNAVLERAGLLAFDEAGVPDPARTDVALSPAGDGSVWVNSTGRPGGRVPPAAAAAVLDRAEAALRACSEPVSGRPVLTALRRAGDGLPAALGDAYAVLAPGFHPDAGPAPGGDVVAATRKTGSHVVNDGSDSLLGILAARGPGLPDEWRAEVVDNRDVAPGIAAALGRPGAAPALHPRRAAAIAP